MWALIVKWCTVESLPLVVNGQTSSLWSRPLDLSWPCCGLCPVDSIEANVENAEVHVERGAEQLQRAAHYQVRALLLLLLLLLHHVGRKTKPLVHHHLLSPFSLTAKIPEEDVHPGHGLLHCTDCTHHHSLEGFQLKPLLTTTCVKLPLLPTLQPLRPHAYPNTREDEILRRCPTSGTLHVRCLNLWF